MYMERDRVFYQILLSELDIMYGRADYMIMTMFKSLTWFY